MLLPPLLIALVWIALTRSLPGGGDSRPPLIPATLPGRLALASLALMVVVVLASASLAATVPSGVVMLALASFARWGRRDRATLLALPFTFGAWLVVVPILIEIWNALHGA